MKNYNNFNKYLADIAVLNAKLHNLHWNVIGSQFKAVHEYLETIYDFMFEAYDEVAELMKMQGVYPLVKLTEFIENTGITELDSKDYTDKESLKIALDDLKYMNDFALKIRNEADEAGNLLVVNLLEDHMAAYAKDIWFIDATLTK